MYRIGEPISIKNSDNKFYWMQERFDTKSALFPDHGIKQIIEQHKLEEKFHKVYEEVKQSMCDEDGCGNPYNLITQEEREAVIGLQIQPQEYPVQLPREFVKLYKEKEMNMSEVIKYFREHVESDCWSIHIRDVNNQPIKVIYDMRGKSRYSMEEKEEDKKREEIMNEDGIKNLLLECYQNEHTICMFMGGEAFIDLYYYPNTKTETFDIIKNEYY